MLFYFNLIFLLFVESNPQWSFGWPLALFLWMGIRCAGVVALHWWFCLRIT